MPQLYEHADPSERRVWHELERMDRRLDALELVAEAVHARQITERRAPRRWIHSLAQRCRRSVVELLAR